MANSYIERHISFGVDEFEGLWKLQFLHPFFFSDTKRVITVYIIPPNSDFEGTEYNGIEVVDAGPHIQELIAKLLPMIQSYPYRWELEGKKLDGFGYDLVSGMAKNSENVSSIDFTDIAFAEINRYYDFAEAIPMPEVVAEGESIERDAALIKIEVVLEKAQWTNQVSFDLFTSYPIEIASIIYQEDTMKYSPFYEISLDDIQLDTIKKGKNTSVSSVSVLFPSVFAKKFTVVLSQPTYTVTSMNSSATNMESYLNPIYDLIWGEEEVSYQSQRIERNALNETARNSNQPEWRPEYSAARQKADEEMKNYEQRLREYQEAESKYKKDMEEYVRYQQQLADWHRKWG